jgi:hypothetical protein
MFIYKDLQNQLAERNGWMVSTNPTAHILTGSGMIELQESEIELEAPDSILDDIVPEVACGSKSFGPAPFYKVHDKNDPTGKKKAIPIHYPTHYWFTGEQLSKLTAFKYTAIIQIIPHKQTLEEEILDTAFATATLTDSGKRLSLKRGRDGQFLSKKMEGWNYIQSRDLSVSQAHVVMRVYDYSVPLTIGG